MFTNIRKPNDRLRAVADAATADAERCFNPKDTVIRFVRSAEQMVDTAKWKRDNNAIDEAFYMFVKFSSLYLGKVRKHPSYQQITAADQKSINSLIRYCLEEGERLKPILLKKFEEEEIERQAKEASDRAIREEHERSQYLAKQQKEQKHRQHHDDAVLANQMEEEEQYALYRGLVANRQSGLSQVAAPAPAPISALAPLPEPTYVPPVSKDCTTLLHSNARSQSPQSEGAGVSVASAPVIDRSLKPLPQRTVKLSYQKITLPGDLASTFLRLALNNTSRDIETCGVLGAPPSKNNEMRVTHVLLPPQRGTPDSCTTEGEEKLFEMISELDLVIIGWIHTHPSQTAFLSSVDLHTHAAYQQLLPESVAVVCSVKYNDTKVFRLTPPGLDIVSMCDQSGFHTHSGTLTGEPLFEECSEDSVVWENGVHVQVVDLRD